MDLNDDREISREEFVKVVVYASTNQHKLLLATAMLKQKISSVDSLRWFVA